MHALEVITARNDAAVVSAWVRADAHHAYEIANANPDLFQVTAWGLMPRKGVTR